MFKSDNIWYKTDTLDIMYGYILWFNTVPLICSSLEKYVLYIDQSFSRLNTLSYSLFQKKITTAHQLYCKYFVIHNMYDSSTTIELQYIVWKLEKYYVHTVRQYSCSTGHNNLHILYIKTVGLTVNYKYTTPPIMFDHTTQFRSSTTFKTQYPTVVI